MKNIFMHDTAIVDSDSIIGNDTKIWVNVQIRENAKIGEGCNLSKDVYIDCNVKIGDFCKIYYCFH